MNASWKTSLCGLLGALCVGLSQIPELAKVWAHVFALLGATWPSIGLLFARDNGVTSEQAGAKKSPLATTPLACLALAGLIAIGAGGCATQQGTAGKLLASTAQTVDAAMKGWAAYVVIQKPPAASEDKVRTIYGRYQQAMTVAQTAYAGWLNSGNVSAWQTASVTLTQERDALLSAVQTSTGKSP